MVQAGAVAGKAAPPAVFLMGPTASGKTGLAVRLAESLPLEIISVDSALVYRGMDIGTAKPGAETLARAPHRLIDICEPSEPYSAARFREDALTEMAEITAAGRVPLLVGGTMLYFRALERGLSDLPAADDDLRRRLRLLLDQEGSAELHRQLSEVDPEAAARIHPNDPQRILRALEVFEITGTPLSEWHRRQEGSALPYRVLKLILAPLDRDELRERIAERFREMLEQGFEEEMRALLSRHPLNRDLPSMRAVGYRQMAEYLAGETDRETMVRRAVDATRQLAKRQMTWLRGEERAIWLDSGEAEELAFQRIEAFLASAGTFRQTQKKRI